MPATLAATVPATLAATAPAALLLMFCLLISLFKARLLLPCDSHHLLPAMYLAIVGCTCELRVVGLIVPEEGVSCGFDFPVEYGAINVIHRRWRYHA